VTPGVILLDCSPLPVELCLISFFFSPTTLRRPLSARPNGVASSPLPQVVLFFSRFFTAKPPKNGIPTFSHSLPKKLFDHLSQSSFVPSSASAFLKWQVRVFQSPLVFSLWVFFTPMSWPRFNPLLLRFSIGFVNSCLKTLL